MYHAHCQAALENTGAIISTQLQIGYTTSDQHRKGGFSSVKESIMLRKLKNIRNYKVCDTLPYARRRSAVTITPTSAFKLIDPSVQDRENKR